MYRRELKRELTTRQRRRSDKDRKGPSQNIQPCFAELNKRSVLLCKYVRLGLRVTRAGPVEFAAARAEPGAFAVAWAGPGEFAAARAEPGAFAVAWAEPGAFVVAQAGPGRLWWRGQGRGSLQRRGQSRGRLWWRGQCWGPL